MIMLNRVLKNTNKINNDTPFCPECAYDLSKNSFNKIDRKIICPSCSTQLIVRYKELIDVEERSITPIFYFEKTSDNHEKDLNC
jgi:hypothetical protein